MADGRVDPLPLTLGTNVLYALPDRAGVTLVDAGPDYGGAWQELVGQLARAGIRPADVRTVALTHAHLDHAGLAARWQAEGARILIGRADAAALAMTDADRAAERSRARLALLRHGVPPHALDTPSTHPQRYTRWPAPLRMTPLVADALLDDGDRIGSGGTGLRAVACPGHTPGTMIFTDLRSTATFTGDHVLPRMAPTSGIQFCANRRTPSLPAYIASLKRVRTHLPAPLVVAYPGHGARIDDLAGAIDWTVRLLETRARKLRSYLGDRPATAYELAARMFPRGLSRQLRPLMAEIIGLLDLLAARDLAAAVEHDARVAWYVHGDTAQRRQPL